MPKYDYQNFYNPYSGGNPVLPVPPNRENQDFISNLAKRDIGGRAIDYLGDLFFTRRQPLERANIGVNNIPGITPIPSPTATSPAQVVQQAMQNLPVQKEQGFANMLSQAFADMRNPSGAVKNLEVTSPDGTKYKIGSITPADLTPSNIPQPVPTVQGPAPPQESGTFGKIGGALAAPFHGENAMNTAAILAQIGQAIMGGNTNTWQYQVGQVLNNLAQGQLYQRYQNQIGAGETPHGVSALSPDLRAKALEQALAERRVGAYEKQVGTIAKGTPPYEERFLHETALEKLRSGRAHWQDIDYDTKMLVDQNGTILGLMPKDVKPSQPSYATEVNYPFKIERAIKDNEALKIIPPEKIYYDPNTGKPTYKFESQAQRDEFTRRVKLQMAAAIARGEVPEGWLGYNQVVEVDGVRYKVNADGTVEEVK